MDLPHSFVEGVREINVSIKKYIPTPEPSRYHTGGGSLFFLRSCVYTYEVLNKNSKNLSP